MAPTKSRRILSTLACGAASCSCADDRVRGCRLAHPQLRAYFPSAARLALRVGPSDLARLAVRAVKASDDQRLGCTMTVGRARSTLILPGREVS
jgi:hypothetical protein